MWFHKTTKHRTPFGEFERGKYDWTGHVTLGARQLEVNADDVDGQPDPQLLHWLTYIDQNLATLEQAALSNVAQLREHKLVAITEGDEEEESGKLADFTLVFEASDEDATDTIYVDFKDGRVIGWQRLD